MAERERPLDTGVGQSTPYIQPGACCVPPRQVVSVLSPVCGGHNLSRVPRGLVRTGLASLWIDTRREQAPPGYRTAGRPEDCAALTMGRADVEGIPATWGISHRSPPVGVSLGPPGEPAAARFRASFLACLRSRRSRSVFSRSRFAAVVLFFELEAMKSVPSMEF
jgi:hypothetical protein